MRGKEKSSTTTIKSDDNTTVDINSANKMKEVRVVTNRQWQADNEVGNQ
mgnify:CR=1 FL=1